ncbi:MAG: ABC transporter substrate-binding protein [Rhodopirellula sp. JB044]|uniref:ABC transporter substrate-binding protein n=1 Tax=Rhodopirellula sp. JB044 TaxID=3342844 RepID=UPI00370C95A9
MLLVVLAIWPCAEKVSGGAPDEIVFGMSTALTGPTADLGLNMKSGVDVAFAEANHYGGINGRRLRLVVLDDGYEPARTVINMRRLIDEENVLGIIGNVGTPTAIAAVPISNRCQVPFLCAFTGAGVLRRDPPDRYVFNYRASYAEETSAMVDALVNHAGIDPSEIAFFSQRDAFGDSGFSGAVEAIRQHGFSDIGAIAHGRYRRNTTSVENALAEILFHKVPPKAIIMVAAYAPAAKFIRLARKYGYRGLFLNVSFVGTQALARSLGDNGEGVVVTQVVPHPSIDCELTRRYQNAMRRFASGASDVSESSGTVQPSFGSLEGYIAGRVVLVALQSPLYEGGRDELVNTMEALDRFSIGLPNTLRFTHYRHQASHQVWATVIRDNKVVPMQWSELPVLLQNAREFASSKDNAAMLTSDRRAGVDSRRSNAIMEGVHRE